MSQELQEQSEAVITAPGSDNAGERSDVVHDISTLTPEQRSAAFERIKATNLARHEQSLIARGLKPKPVDATPTKKPHGEQPEGQPESHAAGQEEKTEIPAEAGRKSFRPRFNDEKLGVLNKETMLIIKEKTDAGEEITPAEAEKLARQKLGLPADKSPQDLSDPEAPAAYAGDDDTHMDSHKADSQENPHDHDEGDLQAVYDQDATIQATRKQIGQIDADLIEANENVDIAKATELAVKKVRLEDKIEARMESIQEEMNEARAAEAAAERAFLQRVGESRTQAFTDYPEARDEKGPLRKRVRELSAQLKKEEDPISLSPKFPYAVTQMAAAELGLLPVPLRPAQEKDGSGNGTALQPKKFTTPNTPAPSGEFKKITGADALAEVQKLPKHQQHEIMREALKASRGIRHAA